MFHNRLSWYLGLSAYWFAASFKWFILLVVLLPSQVASVSREGEKNTYWGLVFAIGATWAIIGPSIFGHWSDRAGKRVPFVLAGAVSTCGALAVLGNCLKYLATGVWLPVASGFGRYCNWTIQRARAGACAGRTSWQGKRSDDVTKSHGPDRGWRPGNGVAGDLAGVFAHCHRHSRLRVDCAPNAW